MRFSFVKLFFFKKALLLGLLSLFSLITHAEGRFQKDMLNVTESIFYILETQYPARESKQINLGWDVLKEKQKLLNKINSGLSEDEFYLLLNQSLLKLQDHHMQVTRLEEEISRLPFELRESHGRFFVVNVFDTSLGIDIGDELLSFNNRPVKEEFEKNLKIVSKPSQTERTYGAIALTKRGAFSGHTVSQGPVSLFFRNLKNIKLSWDKIKTNLLFSPFENRSSQQGEGHHRIGSHSGFIPILGEVIEKGSNSLFPSYIFSLQDKKIGFLRIPHYKSVSGGRLSDVQYMMSSASEFHDLVLDLESKTDLLIIDQTHNPGGIVVYAYSLLSSLITEDVSTPLNRYALTREDYLIAQDYLQKNERQKAIENIEVVPFPRNEKENLKIIESLTELSASKVKSWESGKFITDPMPLILESISPHPKGSYSKPLVILVDERTVSSAEIFSLILKDSKRATIFGTQTAGAGGLEYTSSLAENRLGITSFSYAKTMILKSNGDSLETLGVTPDVVYEATPLDYQNNFEDYKSRLLEVVGEILNKN